MVGQRRNDANKHPHEHQIGQLRFSGHLLKQSTYERCPESDGYQRDYPFRPCATRLADNGPQDVEESNGYPSVGQNA